MLNLFQHLAKTSHLIPNRFLGRYPKLRKGSGFPLILLATLWGNRFNP
jgi:hypothetical protein